jgi:hypothetical protein
MSTLTAAELKRRGVSALAPVLRQDGEAVITVHGKGRYVVMTVDKYGALRELELSEAVREARADHKAGRITDTTIKGHIRRIHDFLIEGKTVIPVNVGPHDEVC